LPFLLLQKNKKNQKISAAAEAARATAWLQAIPYANTYYPTPEQFADPVGYIQSIQAEASLQGERRKRGEEKKRKRKEGREKVGFF